MPRGVSARRYAQAVFQIALEQGELERWLDDLTLLARALEDREFSAFLDAPQVPTTRKVDVLRDTLGDSVDPLALNLLSLVASRSTANGIPSILDQYQRLLDEHRGIERVEVVSAVVLDDEQRQKVTEFLRKLADKEIRMVSRVEPSILGGLIARVGDRVVDGSARTKVNLMRRELVQRFG